MSPKQIVPSPDIKRLLDEGYEVEIKNGYLLIHAIPYVNTGRAILKGTIVTDINENAGQVLPPKNHQVWFVGEYPCHQTGAPIEQIRHTSDNHSLWEGCIANHRFSNIPHGGTNYPDYYSKMTSYIHIIWGEARALDSSVDPRTFRVIPPIEEDSVFRYRDSASSRADILILSRKLAQNRIAIIGLGGTGAYVLDLVAKTPVQEIHLFDGDKFLQHNAFRSPGAASYELLEKQLPKVHYYQQMYDAMRKGIIPHNEYVTKENIEQLTGFDFVFICVDNGPSRKIIAEFLQAQGIPFIDVGMELVMIDEVQGLTGTCRMTMSTPAQSEHFPMRAPVMNDDGDDLYRRNIQVADMNSLNASLAVIRWKQHCGFYQDNYQPHHSTFSINSHSLTRDDMTNVPGE